MLFPMDAAHLARVLENLVEGHASNPIKVSPETAENTKVALQRMHDIV